MQAAAGPVEVQVAGRTGRLEFPGMCANCGAPPAGWLRVEKAFDETVEVVRFPFCAACMQRHHNEARKVGAIERALMMFRSYAMIPAVCMSLLALWIGPGLLSGITDADLVSAAISLAVVAFMALIAAGCLLTAFRSTRHLAVIPPTSVTAAVSFSGDHSRMFEPQRRVFGFRNVAFGEQFRQVNAERLWNPSGAPARRAAVIRTACMVLAGAALALALVWNYLPEFD